LGLEHPERLLAIVLLYPIIASAILLLWPERIRERAERYYAANPRLAKLNPMNRWLHTPHYVTALRVQGAVGLVIFFGLLVAMLYL
jgi:hypothetical protein